MYNFIKCNKPGKSKKISFSILAFIFSFFISFGQTPIIVDHSCTELLSIPTEWIDSAKNNLYIAYGHTSHGSQLCSGMDAIEDYYTNGQYNWSNTGGADELHLFEGDGYGTGYMDHDCGYVGWDDETREYLDLFPDCNVIIWSWCGQVNNVDLTTHYLNPMEQLEVEYPNVKFVYMTGHLEGLGPNGSLYIANQQIRDFCSNNNKILFDFADIEKYSPNADTNFQQYYATDACNYNHPNGGVKNWATDWINNNPSHELTQISQYCTGCAHSENLNCIKKGMASWWLWARLAGWQGQNTSIGKNKINTDLFIYPNPTSNKLIITNIENGQQLNIIDTQGVTKFKKLIKNSNPILVDVDEFPNGVYIVQIIDYKGNSRQSIMIKQ